MAELLKNRFLQRPFLDTFGASMAERYPDWSQSAFLAHIYTAEWEAMELKERMRQVSMALGKCLPRYAQAIEILKTMTPENVSFDGLLYSQYVLDHGLDHPDISLDALEKFTQQGSAEFAIRPFIMKYEDKTMKRMLAWSQHENVHVRRLSSEGCRPRLPWAPAIPQFKQDPSKVLTILENLKDDPELYVRKSVANNLNDIAKDHPHQVIGVTRTWNKKATENTKWIIRQALRSLIKEGHPEALAVLGFAPAKAEIKSFSIPAQVQMGDKFKVAFELVNLEQASTDLLVDYIIFHQKANGTLTPKVFKIGTYTLEAGESKKIEKQHAIIPITTRKYYPGEHRIAVQVNGVILAEQPFILKID